MLLESSFHSLFCLKFSFKLVSNWLLFLRVMQENKIGCFFLYTVYVQWDVKAYYIYTYNNTWQND